MNVRTDIVHPEYLDDEAGVQFVRYDLADNEDAALEWLRQQGLYGDAPIEISTVWMRANPEPKNGCGPFEWYDVVPEAEGEAHYWKIDY